MKKIKIIHVIEQLGIGGKEKFVINLCNHLDTDLFEIYLISLTNSELTLKNVINPSIRLICLNFQNPENIQQSRRFMKNLFSLVPPLIKIFRTIKPDLIHSHNNYFSLFFVSLAYRIASRKALFFQTIHITNHHFANKSFKFRMITALERISLFLNKTYLISISSDTFRLSQQYYKNTYKINKLIWSGIDTLKCNKANYGHIRRIDFQYLSSDIIAIYVARIDENKNHEIIVRAAKELNEKCNNLKFIFVGDGPTRSHLEKLVRDLKLTETIRFTGFVNIVYEYLSISDIGVISSLSEAFPLVLLEKMNMELPVVASDIPIFRELITVNENGYLFNPANVDELVGRIEFLYYNKAERLRLGANAARIGMRFSLQEMVHQYSLFYQEVFDRYKR